MRFAKTLLRAKPFWKKLSDISAIHTGIAFDGFSFLNIDQSIILHTLKSKKKQLAIRQVRSLEAFDR
jgi:hypothetical protein